MIAAVVAAVGLAVTAWGTVKGAQVADDQLAQSQEQREDAVRAEVEQTAIWRHDGKLIFVNRSPNPVIASLFSEHKLEPRDGNMHHWTIKSDGKQYWGIGLGHLPPCTRFELSTKAGERLIGGAGIQRVDGLHITDLDGGYWLRWISSPLERSPVSMQTFDPPSMKFFTLTPIKECKGTS